MNHNDKTKENIFGSVYNTPGQNIHHAIIGGNSSIGIPPYNYAATLAIFRKALRPDEADLLCRGFGLARPRQSQKEIAADLNMTKTEVSRKAHIYIEKLQRSPYKSEIKDLSPTAEDLFNEIIGLRAALASKNSLEVSQDELKHRLANAQASLKQAEASRAQLMSENAKLTHDLKSANKMLRAADEINRQANNEIARLNDRLAKADVFREQAENVLDEVFSNAKADFHARISKIQSTITGIVSLNLSKDTVKTLKGIGIDSTLKLCQQSRETLSKFKVSQTAINEIIAKLKKKGLTLRA